MHDNHLLILKGSDVLSLLTGQEAAVLERISLAYQVHGRGSSSLPHSVFLRFNDNSANRIIALPAFLGENFGVTGLKWIASFPGNLQLQLDRASAVVILNSTLTGRPSAVIEGSVISAKRTAASAALAAMLLHSDRRENCAGLVGCGLINFEIVRFLIAACPEVKSFVVYDIDGCRAEQFKQKCESTFEEIGLSVAHRVEDVFERSKLISFATTASKPHIFDRELCTPGTTILHVSLRDLSPELILAADNVVDDMDHVCRAQTSVHLAEQMTGGRSFIRCTLADVLLGRAQPRQSPTDILIFSPFGLGILDLAVSQFVCELALQSGLGTSIEGFLPEPWVHRAETCDLVATVQLTR